MSDKQILWQGKYIQIAQRGTWEFVERIGSQSAAIIVPVLYDTNKVLNVVLIKEWRIPLQKYNVGLPAGLVGDHDANELVETAAVRELEEETGYLAKRMKFLCSGPPSSGLSTEILHFYLADKLCKTGEGGGVDGEDITVHTVPFCDIEEFLKKETEDGSVVDPKIYMGLYFIGRYMSEIE